MQPLGISIRSNDEGYSKNKARHRRWETVEIGIGLDDCGDPGCMCCEFIPPVYIELEDDEIFGLSFAPPIPRVTLFDAYMAKRK